MREIVRAFAGDSTMTSDLPALLTFLEVAAFLRRAGARLPSVVAKMYLSCLS
jgi:hypothetical protein